MVGRFVLAAAALAAAAPSLAQKPAAPPPAPALDAAAERQALAFAAARGRLLFAIDRAAWVATDDLAERLPDWQNQGVRGYVVERAGDGFAVTFFGGPEDAPVAIYRGEVRDRRVRSRQIFPAAARPPLTAEQRRLVAARQAAAAATRNRPCGSAPFNTAVIPPETPDAPVDVYLLTPQIEERAFPMGGHYRLTVAADGSVGGERAFANSCLVLGGQGVPEGGRAAAMMITHLLDPVPTEIHVFTSISSRLPIYVMAGGRLWEVRGGDISEARR